MEFFPFYKCIRQKGIKETFVLQKSVSFWDIYMKYIAVGLETIKQRRWFQRLCFFYKILNDGVPG